jgi:predicted DNA-binding antitoxin AbrB/MazE fold protein
VQIRAAFQDGVLRPTERLALRQGEKVRLIVQREPDPARWSLERLRATASADRELAETGLDSWADALDSMDRG